jgi:hypothetical protein
LSAISVTPHLREFTLYMQASEWIPSPRFNALARASQLRSFTLETYREEVCSDEQIDDLRSLHQLHALKLSGSNSALLCRLLRAPHQLQLQSVKSTRCEWQLDEAAAEALTTLPTLTQLNVKLRTSSLRFLAALPALHTLQLDAEGSDISPESMAEGLRACGPQLTHLVLLSPPFLSAHLCTLLPHLPRLARFELWKAPHLESLRCFADLAALASTLTDLTLDSCPKCPTSELVHLYGLRSLQKLRLTLPRYYKKPTEEERSQLLPFVPPTARVPDLRSFQQPG